MCWLYKECCWGDVDFGFTTWFTYVNWIEHDLFPDQQLLCYVCWSLEKVGMEKKIIAGMMPNNSSDVQYEIILKGPSRLCLKVVLSNGFEYKR